LILTLLACLPSNNIEVWLKTEENQVQLWIESISIRAQGQEWYQEWHPLEPNRYQTSLSSEYTLVGTGIKEHHEYHHIFLDAHSIFLEDEEIGDVLEPIALDRIMTNRFQQIYLDAIILEAPRGISIFLTNATVK